MKIILKDGEEFHADMVEFFKDKETIMVTTYAEDSDDETVSLISTDRIQYIEG